MSVRTPTVPPLLPVAPLPFPHAEPFGLLPSQTALELSLTVTGHSTSNIDFPWASTGVIHLVAHDEGILSGGIQLLPQGGGHKLQQSLFETIERGPGMYKEILAVWQHHGGQRANHDSCHGMELRAVRWWIEPRTCWTLAYDKSSHPAFPGQPRISFRAEDVGLRLMLR